MKEKIGKVFSIAVDNPTVHGCTISKEIHSGKYYIAYYSIARNTDISAEIYPYHKMIIIADGQAEVYMARSALSCRESSRFTYWQEKGTITINDNNNANINKNKRARKTNNHN